MKTTTKRIKPEASGTGPNPADVTCSVAIMRPGSKGEVPVCPPLKAPMPDGVATDTGTGSGSGATLPARALRWSPSPVADTAPAVCGAGAMGAMIFGLLQVLSVTVSCMDGEKDSMTLAGCTTVAEARTSATPAVAEPLKLAASAPTPTTAHHRRLRSSARLAGAGWDF